MIAYPVYKVIHLMGILMIFLSVGGIATQSINGAAATYPWKKGAAITHGVGLLFALVGGFGLLARLGMVRDLPGWAITKIIIWTIFGGITGLLVRKPQYAKQLWFVIIALGGFAAYLAGYKPY